MKLNPLGPLVFLLWVSIFQVSWAQTYKTNVQDVILKNVRCSPAGGYIRGNFSNRSANSINSILYVTIFDQDGDPINNGLTQINIGPVSGDEFSIERHVEKVTSWYSSLVDRLLL